MLKDNKMNFIDWNGNNITIAKSKGGVKVVSHPFSNLIKTGCEPWPPPEVVQKLYQSRQIRAFSGDDLTVCTSGLGYYCDLQSMHSEDAITWSVFGTASRAKQTELEGWLADLFKIIPLPNAQTKNAEIFLWRRIPHPHNLVPGGPEIDIGISTSNTLILCEAKWMSNIATSQGRNKDTDQVTLRVEYLKKYGTRIYPKDTQLVVLGISLLSQMFTNTTTDNILIKSVTWEQICSLNSHPIADEIKRYFEWKKINTKKIS